KEAEITRSTPSLKPVSDNLRHGFVYERLPHITLKSIAGNAEIDVIWEKWQSILKHHLANLNRTLSKSWREWEVPREVDAAWPASAKEAHAKWWEARSSQ